MGSSARTKGLESLVESAISEMTRSTEGLTDYAFASSAELKDEPMTVAAASVIGFSGEQMKGSLVVSCSLDLLRMTHPNNAMGMPVGDAEISDWLGEIANQVLGRVKNKAAAHGVKFAMATPTVVMGKQMSVRKPVDGVAVEIHFTGAHGPFTVHFMTVLAPNASFDAATSEVAEEGASILF